MGAFLLNLNGGWRFRWCEVGDGTREGYHKADQRINLWRKGSVPGSVQGDLFRLGDLPDPFFGQNALLYRWIEEKEWWYARDVVMPEKLQLDRIVLRFEGVDTLAVIYVNGIEAGRTSNMFTAYEFDITRLLVPDLNRVTVRLDPVMRAAGEKDKTGLIKKRDWFAAAYIRKANFAYGDDMSQRFITTGIWRAVEIAGYRRSRIANLHIATDLKDKNKKAVVKVALEIDKFVARDLPLALKIEIVHRGNRVAGHSCRLYLKRNRLVYKTFFDMPHPSLWWPNGFGEQNLYDLRVSIADRKGKLLDEREDRFGIRKIALIQENDRKEGGKTFGFEVNGVRMFAKGANWSPLDIAQILPKREKKQKYRELIELARAANFNMFRVNGGGYYEDREFYDACDEAGIMVWQDFMFSDCMYFDDDNAFVNECRREAEYVVRMLRNRACVILWCGNNEVDEIYYLDGHTMEDWRVWGEKIFHKLFPNICRNLDAGRPYWPSSSWSASGKHPLWEKMGDYHLYPIFGVPRPTRHPYGRRPYPTSTSPDSWNLDSLSYRLYGRSRGKFYSEFGQVGVPSLASLKKIMDKRFLWPVENNPAWDYHVAVSCPKRAMPATQCY